MNPSHRPLALGAALILAGFTLPSAASAPDESNFAESRGYQTCLDGARREARIIRTDAEYYIYEHADSRRFYLNGYAFRNGDSTRVKIACDTTRSGRRLLDVSVDAGSYAARLVEPVDIANN